MKLRRIFLFIGFTFLLSSVSSNCWLHPLTGSDELQEILGLTSLSEEELEEAYLALLSGGTATDNGSTGGTTSAGTTKIVIYNAGVLTANSVGGLTAADTICASSSNKPSDLTTTYAFTSFSTRVINSIPVPAGIAVQGPTGTQIDTSFADIWAGNPLPSLQTSLNAANVTNGSITTVWLSGSTSAGNLNNNCSDWKTAGIWRDGDLTASDLTWAAVASDPPFCTAQGYLLCIGWDG